MKERVFIIGDIHGCANTLKKMILEKIKIRKSDEIYCLGDYIDRGPDSKGVIDFILLLRKQGYQIHTLRGNHEQMMLDSEKDEDAKLFWTKNGGDKTLRSFNVKTISALKAEYTSFFEKTELYVQTKDFILVHAGLNFRSGDPLSDKESMLWIRGFRVDRDYLKGKLLVHGHTPVSRDFILSQPFENAINLDGGCVYKGTDGYGSLFALNFYERKFLEVKNID